MKKIFTIFSLSLVLMIGATSAQQIFGTAMFGGPNGVGTIFSADSNGNNFHFVYSMDNTSSIIPAGNLCLANNCKLYGVGSMGICADTCVCYSFDPINNIFNIIHNCSLKF